MRAAFLAVAGGRSGLRDSGGDFGIAELGLGLTLELRLGHLDRNHGREAFAEILGSQVALELVEQLVLLGILLERAAETHLEALEMGSAFYGVDVVDIGIYLLGIAVVVLQGYVDGDDLVGGHADGVRNQCLGPRVEIFDELAQAFGGIEHVGAVYLPAGGLGLARNRVGHELVHHLPPVGQDDSDALVQERKLTQARRKSVIFVHRALGEYGRVGMEGYGGSRIRSLADHLDRSERLSLGILLHEDLPFAVHFRDQAVRKGVHAGDAHAVKAPGHLVARLAELASGMQHGEHHFQSGTMLLLVHARGDASAVVPDLYRIVLENLHVDAVAEACHGFVDAVVDHLVDEMVETSFRNVSDIHGRALAHRLKTFENLYTVSGILFFRPSHHFFFLCHFSNE